MISQTKKQYKKDWSLTAEAFKDLLSSLDNDHEKASLIYEDIRIRLVRQFRASQSLIPEEQADEVFNRVARRISQGDFVLDQQNPRAYFHQTARFVLLEHQRKNRCKILGLDELAESDEPSYNPVEAFEKAQERLQNKRGLNAIRECRKNLSDDDLKILDDYNAATSATTGKDKRHLHERLAGDLGKSRNALKIVIVRLRKKLIECAKKKLAIVLN
jgi:DNA-directed RNA polymerase specialized sigma24 family protein